MAALSKSEEARLIQRSAAGDRESAGTLIRAHQASLFAYLLRMSGRPEVAEDIAQEAFVRVLSNLDRFDPRYRFSTWLFTIARRLLMNASQKLRPSYDSDRVGAWQSSSDSPEKPVDDADAGVMASVSLRSALMTLTDEQREILVLFHQLDWPISTIAQHMDMPEGTVKSHLHRGRRRLREILGRDERFSESEVRS